MSEEKEILEKIYEKPGAIWTNTEPPQGLRNLVESGEIKPCKVIDLGCGEGFYSIYLTSKGFDVTGIDLSEKAIQYAKANATKQGVNVSFMAMDVANLDQIKEKFDFVLEWALIHMMKPQNRQKYIENVARLLNKGGKYISVAFSDTSTEWGGGKIRKSPLGTFVYYSSELELRELFNPFFKVLRHKIIDLGSPGVEEQEVHLSHYFLLERT